MFKKKPKDREEDAPAPSSPTAHSYGGQPVVTGGSESAAKGGLMDKFSTGRRRLKENLAQKTGKEGADNSEFEERAQRVYSLRDKVAKVRTAIKRQLDCSRALCLACADLGNACAEAEVRDAQFQNAQYQLDDDIRKNLDDAIVKALESLENKLQPFAELEKMVLNRNKLKLDYDYYARKVRDLKERPGSDSTKLSSNEAKLTAAKQRLQEATTRLYKGFGYYDAISGRLCQPEIEMVKKAQQDFFGAALRAVDVMVPRDPKEVAREVEAEGQDGMNAPFTLPASEMSSDHGAPPIGAGSIKNLGASMRDMGIAESPTRNPTSAYVPSSSAPWMMSNSAASGSTRHGSDGAGGGSRGSPSSRGGGSWWDRDKDKYTSSASIRQSSPWGPGGGGGFASPPPAQERARVLYTYAATDHSELSLTEGEILTVVSRDESGWWTGEKAGRRGIFPGNYVSVI